MLLERNGDSFRGEGMYYEHIVTTQGFDRAYSIMYHLRPPTRVKKTETVGSVKLKAIENQELRHHPKSIKVPYVHSNFEADAMQVDDASYPYSWIN
jgi:homogentisate 1,2-dioxygenase